MQDQDRRTEKGGEEIWRLGSGLWLRGGPATSVLGQLCREWPPEKVLGSVPFVSCCLDLPTRPQGFPDHLTKCRTIRLIVRLFSCAPLWTPGSSCLSAVRTPPLYPPPPHHHHHRLWSFPYLTHACSWLLVFPTCSGPVLLCAGRSFDLRRRELLISRRRAAAHNVQQTCEALVWPDGVLSQVPGRSLEASVFPGGPSVKAGVAL